MRAKPNKTANSENSLDEDAEASAPEIGILGGLEGNGFHPPNKAG
jgi:hypothetical protein